MLLLNHSGSGSAGDNKTYYLNDREVRLLPDPQPQQTVRHQKQIWVLFVVS